jgi:radical SAM-linked protein
VAYSKIGPGRFFGHLELVNLFLRALRRAAIPVKYSEGFHPKPRVAFDDPLPTGTESEDERLVVTVGADVPPRQLVDGLNAGLPDGLRVWACSESIEPVPPFSRFRVRFVSPSPDLSRIAGAGVDRERELEIPSAKGTLKKIALKDILRQTVVAENELVLELSREPGKCVRPTDVLVHAFGLSPQAVASARITRLKRP